MSHPNPQPSVFSFVLCSLSQFPTDLFYAGKVRDGITAQARPAPEGFRWPQPEFPVAFLHVEGREQSEGQSKSNQAETQMVIQVCNELIQGGLEPSTIGVVTPYSGQVRNIRRVLRSSPGLERLEVSSVDGFQGREKEVIVFSAVVLTSTVT
jgi:superfamily I DNA and/or RNA helicase